MKLPKLVHADICGYRQRHGAWKPLSRQGLCRKPKPPLLMESYVMRDGSLAHYTTCAVCGQTRSVRIAPDKTVTILKNTAVFGDIFNSKLVCT